MNSKENYEEYDPWIYVNPNPTLEQKKAAQELLDEFAKAKKERMKNN